MRDEEAVHLHAEFKDEVSLLGIGPGREQGKFLAHHRLEVVRLDDGPQSREEILPGLLRYRFRLLRVDEEGEDFLCHRSRRRPRRVWFAGTCCLSQT